MNPHPSTGSGLAEVVGDQGSLPGGEQPLGRAVIGFAQLLLEGEATHDPATEAVAGLVGWQLGEIEPGKFRFS